MPSDPPAEALSKTSGIFSNKFRIVGMQERILDPGRQSIMDEVNLRRDAKVEQALQSLVGKGPVPNLRLRLDPVPGHTITGARQAEFANKIEIAMPSVVVAG